MSKKGWLESQSVALAGLELGLSHLADVRALTERFVEITKAASSEAEMLDRISKEEKFYDPLILTVTLMLRMMVKMPGGFTREHALLCTGFVRGLWLEEFEHGEGGRPEQRLDS